MFNENIIFFHGIQQGLFESRALEQVILLAREPLEWHFKQLDHTVGLSFKVFNSIVKQGVQDPDSLTDTICSFTYYFESKC